MARGFLYLAERGTEQGSCFIRSPGHLNVIERDALAVPVPDLPEDRRRVLARDDRLPKPFRVLIRELPGKYAGVRISTHLMR